jgi:hypothetical protein
MAMDYRLSAEDDHDQTRQIIDAWLSVVDERDPQIRAASLNVQMAAAASDPRLTDDDGEGWHLHYRDLPAYGARSWQTSVILPGPVIPPFGYTGPFRVHVTRPLERNKPGVP